MAKNLSPETKQKLSELAKQRIAEGKMGGAKFGKLGGRPRKRASKAVAEAALEEANLAKLIRVFEDAIAPGQPLNIRIKGAMAWLEIERDEAKTLIQEMEANSKRMDRAELLNMLTEKLTSGPTAKLLRENPSMIIEGKAVE